MFKRISLYLTSLVFVFTTIGSAYAVTQKQVTNGLVHPEVMDLMTHVMKWFKSLLTR